MNDASALVGCRRYAVGNQRQRSNIEYLLGYVLIVSRQMVDV